MMTEQRVWKSDIDITFLHPPYRIKKGDKFVISTDGKNIGLVVEEGLAKKQVLHPVTCKTWTKLVENSDEA